MDKKTILGLVDHEFLTAFYAAGIMVLALLVFSSNDWNLELHKLAPASKQCEPFK